MASKKPETPKPGKPRPGDGTPTAKEFGKFVGKLLNVPKSEIDKKAKLPINRPRQQ